MLTLSDRVFFASLLTLAMFVLVLEHCSRNKRVPTLIPPPPGDWNLRDTNVPNKRMRGTIINDVGYLDVEDAADAGDEQDYHNVAGNEG